MVVWSGAIKRTLSVNSPSPAVQRLNTQSLKAVTGTCGTRTRPMTPTRMKFPLASGRTSSHNNEHCKSGRIRVAFMVAQDFRGCSLSAGGQLRGPDGVPHQEGDRHRSHAAGVGCDLAGDRLNLREIDVADQPRAAFGVPVGDAVDAHIDHDSAGLD